MKMKPLFNLLVLVLHVSGVMLGLSGCGSGSSEPADQNQVSVDRPSSTVEDTSPAEPLADAVSVSPPVEETTPIIEPVVEVPAEQPILTWARDAGGLSHCDRMSIYEDGRVEAVVCRANNSQPMVYCTLTAEQLTQVQAWVSNYTVFSRRAMGMSSAVSSTVVQGRGDAVPELEVKVAAADFAEKYRMPSVKLTDEARVVLTSYNWPGNVRQLKNITEQISIIEGSREIDAETLKTYLPDYSGTKLPALIKERAEGSFSSEREILYKILFDMKKDMTDLKKLVLDMMHENPDGLKLSEADTNVIRRLYDESENSARTELAHTKPPVTIPHPPNNENIQDTEEIVEESLSLVDKEIELIKKALEKYAGKRKLAADELGISERTLYRKIKEYGIDL